jgi:hypothetical protein
MAHRTKRDIMPIGPSSRPQEPLYVMRMALALALAAFGGGSLGLLWHWLSGEDAPDDQIEALSETDEPGEPAAREVTVPSPAPAPTPQPS